MQGRHAADAMQADDRRRPAEARAGVAARRRPSLARVQRPAGRKQLFEPVPSTCTHLLACEKTGQALLIDPVVNPIDRDLQRTACRCSSAASRRSRCTRPALIDYAVLGNRQCGACANDVPEHMREYCEQMSRSVQG